MGMSGISEACIGPVTGYYDVISSSR